MNKKCTKYESLFLFHNPQDLEEHLLQCEDCKLEHEQMNKVSALIQEVKSHYIKKKQNLKIIKVACIMFCLVFGGTTFGLLATNNDISDNLKYGTTLSAEDLGFPVDSYGLILVE